MYVLGENRDLSSKYYLQKRRSYFIETHDLNLSVVSIFVRVHILSLASLLSAAYHWNK